MFIVFQVVNIDKYVILMFLQITESRPLSNTLLYGTRDSDSDVDQCPAHERLQPKLFSPTWPHTDLGRSQSKALTDSHVTFQGQRGQAPPCTDTGNKENIHSNPDRAPSPGTGSLFDKGGKGCHPKMRAKFMYRSGDFESQNWGYDWTSSDNESVVRENIVEWKSADKKHIDDLCPTIDSGDLSEVKGDENVEIRDSRMTVDSSPAKRRRTESTEVCKNDCLLKDSASVYSDITEPAMDDPVESTIDSLPDWGSMTTDADYLLNFAASVNAEHQAVKDMEQTAATATIPVKDDITVTEVTVDAITITVVESSREKGFFRSRWDP